MIKKYLEQIKAGIKNTNCYWSSSDTLCKLTNSNNSIESQRVALFFVEKTSYGYWRLFFYIRDVQKINWSFFNQKSLIAEIVVRDSKKQQWETVLQGFQKKGQFKIYDTFNRMCRDKQEIDIEGVDFSFLKTANEEDMKAIRILLEANFDLYASKIPSLDELITLKETTFLIKDKQQIVAFFITEKKGITLEFRYWLVLPNYRGKKYGSILMKRVLSFDPEIVRTVSWISEKNENVIQAHKQLGFKEDGLTNYILYRA